MPKKNVKKQAKKTTKKVEEVKAVEEKAEVVEEVVKPNIFICSECGKEYKTERGLKKHIESKH